MHKFVVSFSLVLVLAWTASSTITDIASVSTMTYVPINTTTVSYVAIDSVGRRAVFVSGSALMVWNMSAPIENTSSWKFSVPPTYANGMVTAAIDEDNGYVYVIRLLLALFFYFLIFFFNYFTALFAPQKMIFLNMI